ncbi:N-acetyl sugar amidotransferase [Microbacterium sp. NPDC055910]|uniref:N-acetyl sugar amidotransferase n=1 Tax=Microbacterium sp. NPDC055910 TaxID=3345659 RepID=UPI0035D77305
MSLATVTQVCTRTVMDTTDPDVWFDDAGVSSHALRFDELFADRVERAQTGGRADELSAIVDKIKRSGEGKPYDCVIGVSGGVDSSYLVLQAVKLGLRPLAVHFDSGWNSELAVSNIERIVKKLDLDLYTDVVDWREMRDLQLSFFKASVANCDIPTDHAFPAVAYRQAAKYGIKYILTGSNYATESILPKSWGYSAADVRHVKGIQRRFGSVKLRTYPTMGLFGRYVWYPRARGITTVALLNYMPYYKTEAKQAIADELGWRDYGGKHYESVFTRYFQGYYLPTKFGFDKRKAHLSSLILSGQIDREDALAQLAVSDYDDALRRQDEEFIAKKLGVSAEEFRRILDQAPVDHLEYPNEKWLWDLALRVSGKFPGVTKVMR